MGRSRSNNDEGFWYRLRTTNRRIQGIIIGALVTLLAITFFPGLYPAARQGIECTDLGQPVGGNNRSVLAYRDDQTDKLDLDLNLESRVIGPNGTLEIELVFINESRGPVILHIPDQGPFITSDPGVQGITFEIASVTGAVNVINQPAAYTPPTAFTGTAFETLHLLGSRSRCHETIRFDSATLSNLGLVPGQDYRIRAFYRNVSDGDLNAASAPNATATPFPEYATSQGVWTGTASSEEVRFSIAAPGAVVP